MKGSYPNSQKTLWEKEKLLVTSNFSFSHSVFKRLVSQGSQKVSLCGIGLILLTNGKNLHGSKLKAFTNDKINVNVTDLKFVLGKVKCIVRKSDNAGNRYLLLFSLCFHTASFLGSLKLGIVL